MSDAILEFEGIEKSFFDVTVLKGITFCLRRGTTLGLIGENGAGKSTLMNLLGGNLAPSAGTMRFDGLGYAPKTPRDAGRAGIAFIHQELNLFSNLTIAENLFLTDFPTAGGLIRTKRLSDTAAALLLQVGLDLAPDTLVGSLSTGSRQLVEIAKALSINPRLLILDEPTTSLTSRETEHLFSVLESLRGRGISMIYISHAIEDVLRVCDDIVVLRDGEVVGEGGVAQFDLDRCVSMMVGREMEQLFPDRSDTPQAGVALQASQLCQPGVVSDISFEIRRGEILGLSGLMGSGRTELARILFGLDPLESGSIVFNGGLIGRLSARERIRKGMAFLTEDRAEEGLFADASIADNITMGSLPQRVRVGGWLGWLDGDRMMRDVQDMRAAVSLTSSARDGQAVKTLSGGNQQKVVLAKWLLNEPSLLILDEPTRGIDVGAKFEIYQLILALADRGSAVLLISSEIEELLGLSDRILVMCHGEIRDEIESRDFDRERILHASIHESTLT